jgi:uncharacterized protein (DUF58 family)
MSGRLAILGLLIFGLLIFGLATVNGGIIALALPLCIYLGAAIRFSPTQPQLTVERTLSEDLIFPGAIVTVKLSIRNDGPDLEEVHIQDSIPAGLQVLEGDTSIYTPLPAGESTELSYTVKSARGTYRFVDFKINYREPFGLFGGEAVISAPNTLLVQPRPTPVKSIPIRPRQTRGFAGPIPSRQGGTGDSFYAVREYKPGDPLRRINWKIASRGANDLFTNIFEQERVADVGIILDARLQSYGDAEISPLFEKVVECTASLADSYLKDGNRVGVLVYGAGILSAFPGTGKTQRQRILQVLAHAEIGTNFALETLEYLPTRFFPAHSQILLISPLQPNDAQILVNFRARGYSVLAICPDVVRFEAGEVAPGSHAELALRISLAERAFLLHQIRRAGVQVIDWDTKIPMDQLARQARSLKYGINAVVEVRP